MQFTENLKGDSDIIPALDPLFFNNVFDVVFFFFLMLKKKKTQILIFLSATINNLDLFEKYCIQI